MFYTSMNGKRKRKRRRRTIIRPTVPTLTTVSTGLDLKQVIVEYHPVWVPTSRPFPVGYGPKIYRSYKIDNITYDTNLPSWGYNLPLDHWYFGKYGLWNKSFDPSPLYLGCFSKAYLRKKYSGYYLKEILHRPWALGDRILIQDEEEIVGLDHPVFWWETSETTIFQYQEHRHYKYVVAPMREAEKAKDPFLPPEKTMNSFYPGGRVPKKELKLPVDLRRPTVLEAKAYARFKGFPEPIFDAKYRWINIPNPNYIPPVVDAVKKPPPQQVVENRRNGKPTKGSRFDPKIHLEFENLKRTTQVSVKPRRHLVRGLRVLERHLINIVNLSNDLLITNKSDYRSKLNSLYSLIAAVPFKHFFNTKNFRGSIQDLPEWARRIVSRNLKQAQLLIKLDPQ